MTAAAMFVDIDDGEALWRLWLQEVSGRVLEDQTVGADLGSAEGWFIVLEDQRGDTYELLAKAASRVDGERLLKLFATANGRRRT